MNRAMDRDERGTGMDRASKQAPVSAAAAREALSGWHGVASAALVNRTHRVIHQRAKSLKARRRTLRSLWIPLAVSGGLLGVIVSAIWSNLDQYELTPTGLPDANQQMLVLMMWCLPVSALFLAIVWMRRSGNKADNGRAG